VDDVLSQLKAGHDLTTGEVIATIKLYTDSLAKRDRDHWFAVGQGFLATLRDLDPDGNLSVSWRVCKQQECAGFRRALRDEVGLRHP
jgi:hypothetical protein